MAIGKISCQQCENACVYSQEKIVAAVALGFMNVSNLRRVRKAEAPQSTVRTIDPYATCMACWVDYMRTDDRDLGAGGMKLLGDGVNERDLHEQQRAADMKIGESVNAMVDSLQMRDRWAIYKSQGIASAWRFPNARYEDVLMDARDELEKKLRNNLATRLYWA